MKPKNIFEYVGEKTGDEDLKKASLLLQKPTVKFQSDVHRHRENLSKLHAYFEISKKYE
jgi:hypothetical protein